MNAMPPVVWIVGDTDRAEMRSVVDRLATEGVKIAEQRCAEVSAVEARLAQTADPPDLVLVCESWPDEFPADHVTRLLAAVPLARVVCLSGYWCESAARTRSHWPPALRVPIWTAWPRIERELEICAGRRVATPSTASREELLLDAASIPVPSPPSAGERARVRGRARVEIVDQALSRLLADELQQHGWDVTNDPADAVSTVILQADPASDELCCDIAARCRDVAPAEVVAITAWPTPQWTEQLRAAGVCAAVNALALALPHVAHIACGLAPRAGREAASDIEDADCAAKRSNATIIPQ